MSAPETHTAPGAFQLAFGQPRSTLGKDSHWALFPGGDESFLPINVLLNGSAAHPIVWVFDPYDRTHNTLRRALESLQDSLEVIGVIKDRLEDAHKNNPSK